MKQFLTLFIVLFSIKVFCQMEENQTKNNLQEGEVFYFDMNKDICGQKFYIKTRNDTILVNRSLMDLKIDLRELPIEVYLSISDNDNSRSCSGNYKTLSYIKIKNER